MFDSRLLNLMDTKLRFYTMGYHNVWRQTFQFIH